MSTLGVAGIAFVGMLALIAIRMPIALAMLATGSLGYIYLAGWGTFLNYMKSTPYYLFSNYTLSVIPLFILMGAFAERSGLARDLFAAARALIGHMRGGLAYAVIAACTVFGAICGSSVATTATFGRAALPELRRYNYDGGFATGTIAIGGVVDLMIPPSIILVVYAIVTEQNIAKLFQAALIPGLMAVSFYCIVIFLVVRFRPHLAPTQPKMDRPERVRSVIAVWPALLVILLVIGGIYSGIFTPTEAAAVGTVAMLAVGLLQRSLSFEDFKLSFLQTAETSAMIFAILLGAEVFDAFLALSQMPQKAAELVASSGLSPYGIMFALMIFYILLGAVMDELAMMLLTLPVFFPIVTALDFGMPPDEVGIWFGILMLTVVGIGLTAPPIGLNVFVVSSIAKDVPITRTYAGVLPYIGADIVRLTICVLFPSITLVLVRWLN
ncbi:sialic acid TRAP transporter permease protein SiaT [Variibacter gotjawalensis]|uniref:TRAP transporter large permease protein n=1 Tax=Variibacter gotjawalensis TaxID=1333996 RepID=A0A0S3PZG8_9BRAD|nr:TRAP transporter large permease [Variibacter gotjawalensis]NIK46957.1 tripartite ATP-independent transporter DctM subunit [Variibacter gotjawalensis]RZS48861.1 tripartite ATP-independent transporter DctM subunit [Variibacter gotjawalensis]BAT61120.1 sialic acid TRAP transporter permease protein SiaT [Variibacter gotjawalensis]